MRSKSKSHTLKSIFLMTSVLGMSFVLSGCDSKTWCQIKAAVGIVNQEQCTAAVIKANAGPEVGVFTLKAQPFTLKSELPGRVLAYRTAEIRPQVSGVLLTRHFVEGTDVEPGVSLYQIDPAPFESAVRSAEGNLIAAKASADIANITVNRFQSLLGTNALSRQDFDNALATKRQADAAVKQAEASLENAKINLEYTKVNAPIGGRIGRSNFTEGALVSTTQTTPLATINQLNPVYIDIPQSSREYQYLRNKIITGNLSAEDKTVVQLKLENGEMYNESGIISFSDIAVNPSTGSITLRAEFPNPNLTLLPGMFVNTVIEEGVIKDAILIPQQAVQRTPTGQAAVIVVTPENTIENRIVTVDRADGNMWLSTDGVKAGERVLVSGLARLQFLSPDNPFVSPVEEDPNAPKPTSAPDAKKADVEQSDSKKDDNEQSSENKSE
ncbi:efflux RND transporter periplasmic adaptor subunit [Thorsellia anophelis]|uniref:Membrane fusion protein, multidrug efflux system n=1 Tax=Thorsellia anophelis DSM 18579 TaxID=1123402 RepID=A0A1H9YM02_9GAMM|nr:efflux RND transporter periplasmic adaptor subunit [Thorsellia anophelis]SES70150.1 membrane fusion protein, multidrug efflux system [Thorsellia anophelis DSM 18579]